MKKNVIRYLKLIFNLSPVLLPAVARASSFGGAGDFNLVDAIGKVSKLLSGSLGGAVLVLALMIVGYMWLARGTLPKHKAMAWMGGASLIFGANWIYGYIWGSHS